MKCVYVFVVLCLARFGCCSIKLDLQRTERVAPRYVGPTVLKPNLAQRDTSEDNTVALNNYGYFYSINLTLGTPPQQFKAIVDTGSADLWVSSVFNHACFQLCSKYGSFNDKKSTTYCKTEYNFKSQFVGGTCVTGKLSQDVLTLNNEALIIPNMTFGYVTKSRQLQANAILGLGLPLLESVHNYKQSLNCEYPTFLDQLYSLGKIDNKIFAINLKKNDLILGGYDKTLQYEQFSLTDPHARKYLINMTSMTLGNAKVMNKTCSVLLDSGTNFLQVEQKVAMQIGDLFNATWYKSDKVFLLPNCTLDSYFTTKLNLHFSDSLVIGIPLDSFVSAQNNRCALDLLFYTEKQDKKNPAGRTVLGTPFFQNAYVVFDRDNKQIMLSNGV